MVSMSMNHHSHLKAHHNHQQHHEEQHEHHQHHHQQHSHHHEQAELEKLQEKVRQLEEEVGTPGAAGSKDSKGATKEATPQSPHSKPAAKDYEVDYLMQENIEKTQSNEVVNGHDQHKHHHSNIAAGKTLIQEDEGEMDPQNPCSYLGCNSHKCEWASGGSISRLVAKRACKNSQLVGSGSADNVASLVKINKLQDCMHAVRGKTECSGSFQMHKDTSECSCVPAGDECAEAEDENICRFQILGQ